jgi:uncharacterized protein
MYKLSVYNVFSYDRHSLINTETGALITIHDDDFFFVIDLVDKHGDLSDLTENQKMLFSEMLRAGLIIDETIDEQERLRNEFVAMREGTNIMMLSVLPTLFCQLSCPYCYQREHPAGTMTEDVENALIDFLKVHFKQNSVRNLILAWFGGEPLLAFPVLQQLSQKIRGLCNDSGVHLDASITTNGILLDSRKSLFLYKNDIRKAQLTLDGPKRLHDIRKQNDKSGTYHRIIETINVLAETGIDVNVRINIDKLNSGYLDELISDLSYEIRDKSRVGLYLARLIDYGAGGFPCLDPKEFAILKLRYLQLCEKFHFSRSLKLAYPSPRHSMCIGTHKNSLIIDPNGYLYKCMSDIGQEKLRIGSVFEGVDSTNSNFLQWTNYRLNEECARCNLLPACGGRCPRGDVYCSAGCPSQGSECLETRSIFKDIIDFYAHSKIFKAS